TKVVALLFPANRGDLDFSALQCALSLPPRATCAGRFRHDRMRAPNRRRHTARLLGLPPDMRLAMPMGPAYGGLAVWLMVKGFYEGHRPVDTKEYGVGAAVGAIGASAPGSSS